MPKFKTMSTSALIGIAMASLCAMSGNQAEAATMVIGLQSSGVNGGAITTEASSSTGGIAIAGLKYGDFQFSTVAAQVGLSPGIFDSDALNTTTLKSGGEINVYVSETGLTGPLNVDFISSFTANNLPTGWTVTEETYLDSDNVAFVDGVSLSQYTFVSPGVNGVTLAQNASTGPGPYSLTEEYMITAISKGQANDTIDISGVPEPASWAMMLLGVGGMGAVTRSRRRLSRSEDRTRLDFASR
jgi:hypothetical protein